MPEGTDEVRAAAEAFLRALDNLDWEGFAACWAADPTAFFPSEEARLDGRAGGVAT
jgi:hypothetical protein